MRSLVIVSSVALAACPSSSTTNALLDAPGSAPDAAAPDAAPLDAAPLDAGGGCSHQFDLASYGSASSVWVSGDFVDWAATPGSGALVMTLDASDATWEVTHGFAPGTYQYKFIIDGSDWVADPANPDVVDDGFGGVNSIYICGSGSAGSGS